MKWPWVKEDERLISAVMEIVSPTIKDLPKQKDIADLERRIFDLEMAARHMPAKSIANRCRHMGDRLAERVTEVVGEHLHAYLSRVERNNPTKRCWRDRYKEGILGDSRGVYVKGFRVEVDSLAMDILKAIGEVIGQ